MKITLNDIFENCRNNILVGHGKQHRCQKKLVENVNLEFFLECFILKVGT